jgi:hypothetical protein
MAGREPMSKRLKELEREFQEFFKNWNHYISLDPKRLNSGSSTPCFGPVGDEIYLRLRTQELEEHEAREKRKMKKFWDWLKVKEGVREVKNWENFGDTDVLLKLPDLDAYVGYDYAYNGDTIFIRTRANMYNVHRCTPGQFSRELNRLIQKGIVKTDEEVKEEAL